MKDINLPPFVVGQKVLASTSCKDNFRIKGNEYIISEMTQCKKCLQWMVDIGDIVPNAHNKNICSICNGGIDSSNIYWHSAKHFAPIEEQKFSKVEYTKILEGVPCCNN